MITEDDVRRTLDGMETSGTTAMKKANVPVFTADRVTEMLKPYKGIKVDSDAKYLLGERKKKREKDFADVVPEFHRFELPVI